MKKKSSLVELHNLSKYKNLFFSMDVYYQNKFRPYDDMHVLVGSGKEIYNHNIKIEFYKTKKNNDIVYSIHSNNDNNMETCLKISIIQSDPKYEKIVGFNILQTDKCYSINNIYNFNGSQLIDIGIQFLKSIKDKYKFERIVILDNSQKIINSKKFKFPVFYSLINGHTWYGKFNFRPYDNVKEKPDKDLLNIYNKNLELINKTEIRDIKNIINLIEAELKKINYNQQEAKKIINFMKTNLNMKISDFIKFLIVNMSEYTKLLYNIYEKIYKSIGCHDFYGSYFFLDI
jgi:hypothetical protein